MIETRPKRKKKYKTFKIFYSLYIIGYTRKTINSLICSSQCNSCCKQVRFIWTIKFTCKLRKISKVGGVVNHVSSKRWGGGGERDMILCL